MKRPWFQFYTGDWRKDPCLRRCSAATRGIWIDLLCAIHDLDDDGTIGGTVEQLARLVGESPEVMATALTELSATETADVTFCPEKVTVVSRRFQRESRDRKSATQRKKKQRSRERGLDVPEKVTDRQNEDLSSSSSSEEEKLLPHSPAAPEGDSAQSGLKLDRTVGRSLKFDFEAVYALYPRKVGRKKGLQRCGASIKTQAQYDALVAAVKRYAAKMRGTDEKYIKHFDTFMGCWEDYVDAATLPTSSAPAAVPSKPPEEYVSQYSGWPAGFFDSIPSPSESAHG